jgi:flavin reductase (DIM6/NTAB) family NADH-FMN oxidoreductase RutF
MHEVSLPLAHRLFAPRPVAFLTTRYRGRVNLMAVAWVCPVSMSPPMLGVAIDPASYTHDLLRRSGEFVLSIPGRRLAEKIVACGTISGAEVDKLVACGLETMPGHRVDAPLIDGCLAHLECAVVTAVEAGDHTLFIAEVLGAWAEEEAFGGDSAAEGTWRASDDEDLSPLLHLGGRSFCLPGLAVEQT